jgi:ligand-binding sensor protein/putative methionine-R-sulfoxide reductase with GAF domain
MAKKSKKQVSLASLIDLNRWQKIQDIFAAISDISLRTVDLRGKPLTIPSGRPRLCREVLSSSNYIHDICEACLPTFLGGKAVVDRNLTFVCPPSFHNFLVPLSLDNEHIFGYIILGPVILVARKSKDQYAHIAEQLNINLEAFLAAISEIRVLSFYHIQTIAELLKDLTAYVLKLAYENISMEDELTKIDSQAPTRLSEFLHKLLSMAINVVGADIGSIMILNRSSNELSILASHGLPDHVVRSTRMRFGNGISGTAIKENTSFLINESQSDNRIKAYLNRPQIKSSMVLPISVQGTPLGVINLGTLDNSPIRFTSDNVKAMNDFIDLTALAFKTSAK